jgi:hypothetical protein
MGERRDIGTVLGKIDRKRTFGRYTHRLDEILQLFFKQSGRGGADWIDLAQNWDKIRTVVNAAVNIRVT